MLQINTFQSWRNIANADALIKLAPAAGATLLLLLTLKFGRSPLALPAVLVCIPVSCRSDIYACQTLFVPPWALPALLVCERPLQACANRHKVHQGLPWHVRPCQYLSAQPAGFSMKQV